MVEDTRPSDPNPAETLRRAASLMRERAGAMVAWSASHPEESGGPNAWFTPTFIANAFANHAPGDTEDPLLREGWSLNGEHYAAMTPAVALAVAAWLDREAQGFDYIAATIRLAVEIGAEATVKHSTHEEALAVARAYLGESA